MRIFLLLILFLTSCTRFEVGYQLAPRWISNRLDDAFDFKSKRLKEVRAQLNADFNKNHKEVALLIIKLVDEILALAEKKDLAASDFKNLGDSIYKSRKELTQLFKPSVDLILKNISLEESKSLNDFTDKKFKESGEKLTDKDEFLKKQMKTFNKVMDFIFDSANKEQAALFKEFLLANYDYFVAQEEERKLFLKRFNILLTNKDELTDFVLKYYASDLSTQSENYQKKHAAFLISFYDVQLKLWLLTNEKQKKALRSNLTDLKAEVLPFAK